MQIRALLEHGAPLAIIAPGRVYRCDSDMTHSPMFHQLEGLVVGENVSFANMKAVLHGFLQAFFERDLAMRLRPSYFPVHRAFRRSRHVVRLLRGQGCRTCKHTGWLGDLRLRHGAPERAASASGVDPERFTGYAFGAGIDRLAMLRYGVNDLRLFFENDLRFLRQFRAFERMKIPYGWLAEWVKVPVAARRSSARASPWRDFELESLERAAPPFSKVSWRRSCAPSRIRRPISCRCAG